MPLIPGTTLGPYAVTAKIGEGRHGGGRSAGPRRHRGLPDRAEIAETVSDPSEVDDEMRHLVSALRKG